MKKLTFFIFIFISLLSYAQVIHNVSFGRINIINSDIDVNYVEIKCNDLNISDVKISYPSLPSKTFRLIIPNDKDIASIEIINTTIDTIYLRKKILPFQGYISINQSYSNQEFILPFDSIYNSKLPYPEDQITSQKIDYFDELYPIITLNIIPFVYYPNKNILLFYSSFDIKVNLKKKIYKITSPIYLGRSAENQQKYNNILYSLVDNPQDIILANIISGNKYNIKKELTYEYVIITTAELAPAFTEFLMWKKRKGIDIGIITMEYIRENYSGDTISGIFDDAGKVRQFLIDSYKKYNKKLTYALLAGDKNIVPIRIGYAYNSNVPTDLYFSDLTTNWDIDNDGLYGEPYYSINKFGSIFVGRLLCSTNEHVKNWTKKVIKYESNPGNGNFNYLTKAFFTQADELQEGEEANYVLNKATWIPLNNRTVFSEESGYNTNNTPSFPTGNDVITEFNNNYGLVSFMAHGGPTNVAVATKGYNDNDYNSKHKVISIGNGASGCCIIPEEGNTFTDMTNVNYPSIYYSISCETMPFDIPDSINYSMGKTYTCISNGGGPAYLGNTRNGYVGYSRQIFGNFLDNIVNSNCNIGIAESNSRNSINNIYLLYSHNLIGCPETEMWTAIPLYFTNIVVIQNGTSVTVNTNGITGCKIALMSMDYGKTDFKVFVDTNNTSNSHTFTNILSSNYYITVTKHNYIPYSYPQDVYIQNETISNNSYIKGRNIYVGKSVTTSKPQGDVVINNNANVIFDTSGDLYLKKGFECSAGSKIETLKNNY